jgi:hypothetical protein
VSNYSDRYRVMLEIVTPDADETCHHLGCGRPAVGILSSPAGRPHPWCADHLVTEFIADLEWAYDQRIEREIIGLTERLANHEFYDLETHPPARCGRDGCDAFGVVHCSVCRSVRCAEHLILATSCPACGVAWSLTPVSSSSSSPAVAGAGPGSSMPLPSPGPSLVPEATL